MSKPEKFLFLTQIVLFILTPVALTANDGSYSYKGNSGALMAVKDNAVSMESGEIKIDATQAGFGEYTFHYDCLFHFKIQLIRRKR